MVVGFEKIHSFAFKRFVCRQNNKIRLQRFNDTIFLEQKSCFWQTKGRFSSCVIVKRSEFSINGQKKNWQTSWQCTCFVCGSDDWATTVSLAISSPGSISLSARLTPLQQSVSTFCLLCKKYLWYPKDPLQLKC